MMPTKAPNSPMQSLPLTASNILSQDFLLDILLGHMQPKMGDCLKVCQDPWQDCLQDCSSSVFCEL